MKKTSMIPIFFPNKATTKELINGVFLLVAIGLFIYFQANYLPFNFSLFLAVIFAPFLFRKVENEPSHRFFLPAVFFGVLLWVIPSNSLYYIFWVMVLLYLIETWQGKGNNLPLFLFLVVSYISQQILNNWSFPIRLQLSDWAGKVIGYLAYQTEVIGNVIYLDGIPFSIDPACMGLKMMVSAQLIALVILAYIERKNNIVFSIPRIAGLLILVMSLTILANFIRILALVFFHIFPDNPLHDILGLASLLCYVVLPFYALLVGCYNGRNSLKESPKAVSIAKKYKLNTTAGITQVSKVILLALLLFQGIQSKRPIEQVVAPYPIEVFDGFSQSQTAKGVLKLENDSTLIYIKPPVQFFQGSHDPRVCWSGSGYSFTNIKIETIDGIDIYTAILKHKEDQLYTAWWYDNLRSQTIEEWQWRMEQFKGQQGHYLVNVNSLKRDILIEQIKRLLRN